MMAYDQHSERFVIDDAEQDPVWKSAYKGTDECRVRQSRNETGWNEFSQ
jgi:hypothetical protein